MKKHAGRNFLKFICSYRLNSKGVSNTGEKNKESRKKLKNKGTMTEL